MDFDIKDLYTVHTLTENVVDHQKKLVHLVNALGSRTNWTVCASVLRRHSDVINIECMTSEQLFALDIVCCRALENFLNSCSCVTDEEACQFNTFLMDWLRLLLHSNPGVNRKFFHGKISRMMCLSVLRFYPQQISTFFEDLISNLHKIIGETTHDSVFFPAVDIFADLLIELDSFLVSRSIQLTSEEIVKANDIKDSMRTSAIESIISASYHLLINMASFGASSTQQVKKVLVSIGLLSSWVDINLVVSQDWLELVRNLVVSLNSPAVRWGVYEYLNGLVKKGMPAQDKLQLIQTIWSRLDQQVLSDPSLSTTNGSLDTHSSDALESYRACGNLINSIGLQLITAYKSDTPNKKTGNSRIITGSRDVNVMLELSLVLLRHHTQPDLCHTILPFLLHFLGLLKETSGGNALSSMHDGQKQVNGGVHDSYHRPYIDQILNGVLLQLRTLPIAEDEDDDTELKDFRADLRTAFGNMVQIDPGAVLNVILGVIKESRSTILSDKSQHSSCANLSLTVFQLFGDFCKAAKNDHFASSFPLAELTNEAMSMLCSDPFASSNDHELQLKYFEVMVRFERYFHAVPKELFPVMLAFMDKRGLRSSYAPLRSRCAQLVTRLLKAHVKALIAYTDQLMTCLSPLLVLSTEPCLDVGGDHAPATNSFHTHVTSTCNGSLDSSTALTLAEQGCLYEAISQLLSVTPNPDEGGSWFHQLLSGVLSAFGEGVNKLVNESIGQMAESRGLLVKQLVDIVTRCIKAFSQSKAFQTHGSRSVLIEAMRLSVDALNRLPSNANAPGRGSACSGLRALFHRMVSCLGNANSPATTSTNSQPDLSDLLLSSLQQALPRLVDCKGSSGSSISSDLCWRELRDTMPLVNQIVQRYKARSADFTTSFLPPFISVVLTALAEPVASECLDLLEERKLLRRGYLQLLQYVCQDLPQCAFNSLSLEILSETLAHLQACIDCDDPVGLRFGIMFFTQIVEAGAKETGFYQGFIVPNLLPFLILSPMQPSFRLTDAQFDLTLKEAAFCLKVLYNCQNELATYLRETFLPGYNLCPTMIDPFVDALKTHGLKEYQTYIAVSCCE